MIVEARLSNTGAASAGRALDGKEWGGAWGRIRTTDTRIFNPLLYQLSYPGLPSAARGVQGFGRTRSRRVAVYK